MSELSTILEQTASAITDDPSLAAMRFDADCRLVGLHEVVIRLPEDRSVTSDQPPMLGGADAGPKPVEFALAALGSCQAQTYRIWAAKLGIRFDTLEVELQGDVDAQGIFGLSDAVRPGFGAVRMSVRIGGPEPAERYEELRRAVDDHCPVLDVFTNPVPVTTAFSVRDGASQ